MRQRLFLHYEWFLQNFEEGFIRTYIHKTVVGKNNGEMSCPCRVILLNIALCKQIRGTYVYRVSDMKATYTNTTYVLLFQTTYTVRKLKRNHCIFYEIKPILNSLFCGFFNFQYRLFCIKVVLNFVNLIELIGFFGCFAFLLFFHLFLHLCHNF